jgi:prevent-host-death family protein
MARRMSVHEARANFSDVLGSVYHTGEPVIVERRGKPVAVLVSPEQYLQLLPESAPSDSATADRNVPEAVSAEELERRREAMDRYLELRKWLPPVAPLTDEERARRQAAVDRILELREQLPSIAPLTSVDLIRIAREEEEESWGLGD